MHGKGNGGLPFRRLLGLLTVLALLPTVKANALPGVVTKDEALREHILEALRNNPELESRRAQVDAAARRVPQAGAWSDPGLTLGMSNLPTNSFDLNQEPMTAAWITLSQALPVTSKYGIKRQIAEHNLDGASDMQRLGELDLAEEISHTWYDWAYLRESLATLDVTIELLDDLLRIARKKYETGRGLQQDILRSETERTRLEDRREQLAQTATAAGRRMAALMGRDPDDIPGPPRSLQVSFTPLDRESLRERLATENPLIGLRDAELEMAKGGVLLARSSWWPDVRLTAGYGKRRDADDGTTRADFVTITGGITLPVFGAKKQGPAVQEAKAMERRTEAARRDAEIRLRLEFETMSDEDARLEKQIVLYRDGVVPQAEATLAAATAEYSVGKVDIEALLTAETALHNARLGRFARVRDRAKVRASIAALTGWQGLGGEINENTDKSGLKDEK